MPPTINVSPRSRTQEVALPQQNSSDPSSARAQRILVVALLLLALVVSCLVVFHFDPQATLLQRTMHRGASERVVAEACLQ